MTSIRRRRPLFWLAVCTSYAALAYLTSASAADRPRMDCPPILAQLIPGDFHYCVAVRDWEKGRNPSGFFEATYAAEWGDKRAQFDLGVYYFNGRHGVETDHALGLAWLTLAAERGDPRYLSVLASAQAKATTAEKRRTGILLAKMRGKYGDSQTVYRAEKRYRRELWTIRDHVWEVMQFQPSNPWSDLVAVDIDGLGVVQPTQALEELQNVGNAYFQNWGGLVTVGPLVQVIKNGPPSSTSHSPQ